MAGHDKVIFAAGLVRSALAAGRSALDEWESKSLLASYGISVPAGALVKSQAEARSWETSFLEHVAVLMEDTGKPIINVPDHPVHGSLPDLGRYSPVVLSSPRAAAHVLSRMAWYGSYRRRHE